MEDKLIEAMAEYLREKGWNPLVGGLVVIQQQPGERKFNFELVIRFTGAPPAKLPPQPRPKPATPNDVKEI